MKLVESCQGEVDFYTVRSKKVFDIDICLSGTAVSKTKVALLNGHLIINQ
jgi:hypothetical protein